MKVVIQKRKTLDRLNGFLDQCKGAGRSERRKTIKRKRTHERRKVRTRYQLKKKSEGRPRLSVHRTGEHMYAQVIDDSKGVTPQPRHWMRICVRSLRPARFKGAAAAVGKLVAERAIKAGVSQVVFDRGGFVFHGRVKELAEAARKAGRYRWL